MGAVQVDGSNSAPGPKPESKSRDPIAAPESLRLAPIPSLDDLTPVTKKPERLWEDDDSIEYELEKPIARPAVRAAPQLSATRRKLFWGRCGIAETLLICLRKLSDYAYLISIGFLLLLLLAIILKHRELAVLATLVVVLVNIARFAIDGFVLVTLAFKNGPLHGVLFFIPPFTFYYLSKRGKIMKQALGRFLSPALPILGVVLMFIFIPWLRGAEGKQDGTIRDRLRSGLPAVKDTFKSEIQNPPDSEN